MSAEKTLQDTANAEHDSASGADEQDGALDALAVEVLDALRQTLMMSYRFLDRALWKMPCSAHDQIELMGCDGAELRYAPAELLMRYGASSDEAARDLLHLVFHCIFYHPFVGADINPLVWDLSCDIVCEAACMDIAATRFPSKHDDRRRRFVDALADRLGNLSAEKVYRHIMANGIDPKEADYLKALFVRDDHGLWYRDRPPEGHDDPDDEPAGEEPQDPNDREGGEHEQRPGSGADEQPPEEQEPSERANGQDARQDGGSSQEHAEGEREGEEGRDAPSEQPQETPAPQPTEGQETASSPEEQADLSQDGTDRDGDDGRRGEWERISKQVKLDLESQSSVYGSNAGGVVQALRIANRRKQDYRSFLRRFAQMDEEMAVNHDEFDLVYYSYGLSTYGNMPLVEPLEYREAKKVREFVVAIDTSGSVEGALVRRFVEETYSILKSTESFFSEVNIRIMQCDATVQSDVAIRSAEDFERYMRTFELRGFGGTDFRPVFERVSRRIEEGAFENLRGLIYFTDGYGTYPTSPPPYETVFVFADEAYSGAGVPPWAMRLYLDTTTIYEEKQQ